MSQTKFVTLDQIRSFGPCYDPVRYCTDENRKITALDVLDHPHVPANDKLWLVLREDFIDADTLHRFACWCAAEALFALKLDGMHVSDASFAAVKAKLDFLEGRITAEELSAARSAAWSVARSGAWSAARSAAMSAAEAAESAAWSAARSAAWSAALAKLRQMVTGEATFTMKEFLNL